MSYFSRFLVGIITSFIIAGSATATPIQTYYSLGTLDGAIADAAVTVKESLIHAGFDVIGEYAPAGDKNLFVLVYTRNDIIDTLSALSPERMFAAALKVGLKQNGAKVSVSMTNPELIFRAYLQGDFAKAQGVLSKVNREALAAFHKENGFAKPTAMGGGALTSEEVAEYHYLFGMEYFDDKVTVSGKKKPFDTLTAAIEQNLASGTAGSSLVYAIKPTGKKIALYGVGLSDPTDGEPFFLPIIGTDHVAAMPFEMLVINDEAFILHGRYRIALHWPALTMGTFGDIMSTPSDVISQMELIAR